MIAGTALMILCTVLPFLPGSYDSVAVPLSTMVQLLGIAGLALVPVGAVWLAYEYRSRSAGSHVPSPPRGRYGFALAAFVTAAFVSLAGPFAALMLVGPILAVGTLALWALLVTRIAPRLKSFASDSTRHWRVIPLYLILAPLAVPLLQRTMETRATEFSRNRGIRNSAPMIANIERFRAARGHYPPSLLSVHKDYSPGIIGIEQYHYEPSGESYNLFFEQSSFRFGSREFVMYNPLDQQQFSSHKMDILELSPADLDRQRGYHAVNAAAQPHWKYFWFD